MLIQVTTTHGQPFWCADIRFGPQPQRFWLGDSAPRHPQLECITGEQLARMEQFTGDHGPLYIEKGPSLMVTEMRDELRDELDQMREQLDQAERRARELADDNEQLRGRLAGYESSLAEEREKSARAAQRIAEAEKRASEADKRVADAEKQSAGNSRKRKSGRGS